MSTAFIADKCSCGNYKRKAKAECLVCERKVSAYGVQPEKLKARLAEENINVDVAQANIAAANYKKAFPQIETFVKARR